MASKTVSADDFLDGKAQAVAANADDFLDGKSPAYITPSADDFLDGNVGSDVWDKVKNVLTAPLGAPPPPGTTDAWGNPPVDHGPPFETTPAGQALRRLRSGIQGALETDVTPAGPITPQQRESALLSEAGKTGEVPYGKIASETAKYTAAKFASSLVPTDLSDFALLAITPMVGKVAAEEIPALVKPMGELWTGFKDWLSTKPIDVPISAEDIKNFYIFGRERLSPAAYDILQNTDPEILKAAAKAREGITARVNVPRFGGQVPDLTPPASPTPDLGPSPETGPIDVSRLPQAPATPAGAILSGPVAPPEPPQAAPTPPIRPPAAKFEPPMPHGAPLVPEMPVDMAETGIPGGPDQPGAPAGPPMPSRVTENIKSIARSLRNQDLDVYNMEKDRWDRWMSILKPGIKTSDMTSDVAGEIKDFPAWLKMARGRLESRGGMSGGSGIDQIREEAIADGLIYPNQDIFSVLERLKAPERPAPVESYYQDALRTEGENRTRPEVQYPQDVKFEEPVPFEKGPEYGSESGVTPPSREGIEKGVVPGSSPLIPEPAKPDRGLPLQTNIGQPSPGLPAKIDPNKLFPVPEGPYAQSLSQKPEFVKVTKDLHAVASKYAKEQGRELTPEFVGELKDFLHDEFGKARLGTTYEEIRAKMNELKKRFPDIENEWGAFEKRRTMESLLKSTNPNKAQVMEAYDKVFSGSYPDRARPKAGLEAEKGGGLAERGPGYGLKQTETPAFKKWFGESKVVDAEGKPLVVYHGTTATFTKFEKSAMGKQTEAPSSKMAFFFSSDPETASGYSDLGSGRLADSLKAKANQLEKVAQRTGKNEDWDAYHEVYSEYENAALENDRSHLGANVGANVMPVHLKLENPLVHDFRGSDYREESYADLIKQAKREGRDGVIFKNTYDPGTFQHNKTDVFGVFAPTQIKSATGNSGEFSPTNPSIVKDTQGDFYDQISRGQVPNRIPSSAEAPLSLKYKEDGYLYFPKSKISSPADVAFAFKALKDQVKEHLYVVGAKDGVLVSVEPISTGTVDQTPISQIDAIPLLQAKGANEFYVTHNHPSGDITPSKDDIGLFVKMQRAYEGLGITFKGGIIINDTKFGFIDEGMNASKIQHLPEMEGKVKLPQLKMYGEWSGEKPSGSPISSPERVFETIKGIGLDLKQNSFIGYLNTRNVIVAGDIVSNGSITPSEVISTAARLRSQRIVIGTGNLAKFIFFKDHLSQFGINLLDVVTVREGGVGYHSVAKSGMGLDQFVKEEPGLFNAQKENPSQTYDRLIREAKQYGLDDVQAKTYAQKRMAEMGALGGPISKPKQAEFGLPGGVEGFGRGARGESDLFRETGPGYDALGQQKNLQESRAANLADLKYVDNRALKFNIADITSKKGISKTATDIRSEYSGAVNAQKVRAEHLAQDIKKIVKDSIQRQALTLYRDAEQTANLFSVPREEALRQALYSENAITMKIRPAIKLALDPTPEMLKANRLLTQYFGETGMVGREHGFLNNLIDDEKYINRIYKPTPPEVHAKTEAMRTGLGKSTGHAKPRVYETLLDAMMHGKEPATLDAADLVSIHGAEFARVLVNNQLYEQLQAMRLGYKLESGARVPGGWARLGQSNFVVPDFLETGLRAITDPNYLNRLQGYKTLRSYQGLVKTIDLSASLFHHFTLLSQLFYQHYYGATVPSLLNFMRNGDYRKIELDFVRNTGEVSTIDANLEILRQLSDGNDLLAKALKLPVMKQYFHLIEANNKFLFGKMQRYFKVMDYGKKISSWIESHADATDAQIVAAKRSFAKEVNASYGGLNWKALGVSPLGLGLGRLAFLAPDWLASNALLLKMAATERSPGGNAALAHLMTALIGGIILTEGLNYIFTGHGAGKNQKGHQFEVEVRPGVYISFFRGAIGEALKWGNMMVEQGIVSGTGRYSQGKLSPIGRSAMGLLTNTNYYGKPIAGKDQSLGRKTWEAGKFVAEQNAPVPFGISGFARFKNWKIDPISDILILSGLAHAGAPPMTPEQKHQATLAKSAKARETRRQHRLEKMQASGVPVTIQ